MNFRKLIVLDCFVSCRVQILQWPLLLFPKLNKIFVGYFDPEYALFGLRKINNFQGDLTNILAITEPLALAANAQRYGAF